MLHLRKNSAQQLLSLAQKVSTFFLIQMRTIDILFLRTHFLCLFVSAFFFARKESAGNAKHEQITLLKKLEH